MLVGLVLAKGSQPGKQPGNKPGIAKIIPTWVTTIST